MIFCKKSYTLLLFLSAVFINSCSDDSQLLISEVSFELDELSLNTSDNQVVTLSIQIVPPAPADSEIRLRKLNSIDECAYQIEPHPNDRIISIPVQQGNDKVSMNLQVFPEELTNPITTFYFEIFYLGSGLNADLIEGRFASVEVISEIEAVKSDTVTLPYFESLACVDFNFLPDRWEEYVVQQNDENSTNWLCSSAGLEANAFVPESSDNSNSETWLISPTLDLRNVNNAIFRFEVDRRFSPTPEFQGSPFDLMISTNYDRTNFEAANWQRFDPGFEAIEANNPDEDGFTSSTELSLSPFNNQLVTIAFVYRAGAPGSFDATILRIGNFDAR